MSDILNEQPLGNVGCVFLILYEICHYACPAITNDAGLYPKNSMTSDRLIVNQKPIALPAATC